MSIRKRSDGVASYVLFCVFLLILGAMCYLRPQLHPDQVGYAAAVLSIDGLPATAAHSRIMEDVRREFGSDTCEGGTVWWKDICTNPEHMVEQVPFFSIKPIYIATIRALTHIGLPVFSAEHLISAVSIMFVGLFTLFLTKDVRYAALLMLTPAAVAIGRLPTPDALSTAVVLAGLWSVVARHITAAAVLMLSSVFIRTDNVLLAIAVVILLCGRKALPVWYGALLLALASASVVLINQLSGNYGWAVLIRNTVAPILGPGEHTMHFGLRDYLHALYLGMRSAPSQSELAIWAFIGVISLSQTKSLKSLRDVVVMCMVVVVVRFLLFPSPQDRYFVWAYLVIGALLVRSAASPVAEVAGDAA